MGLFSKIKELFTQDTSSQTIENWYEVTFDGMYIYRNVEAPGSEPWSDKLKWVDIDKICFTAERNIYTDDIAIFTLGRPESYLIPIEAKGGNELWSEILDRGLFDHDLAIKALTSTSGSYCWSVSENKILE